MEKDEKEALLLSFSSLGIGISGTLGTLLGTMSDAELNQAISVVQSLRKEDLIHMMQSPNPTMGIVFLLGLFGACTLAGGLGTIALLPKRKQFRKSMGK